MRDLLRKSRNTLMPATEARQELLDLIVLGIVLALVIGWMGDAAFSYVLFLELPSWLNVALMITLALVAGVVIAWYRRRHGSIQTQAVNLEIYVPYLIRGQAGPIEIPIGHFIPYRIVGKAHEMFNNVLSVAERKEIADRVRASSGDLRSVHYAAHLELVQALILWTIDNYSERSVGSSSDYKPIAVDLASDTIQVQSLARLAKNNKFVRAIKNWGLRFPDRVWCGVENTDRGPKWTIQHDSFGSVLISIDKRLSVHVRDQKAHLLEQDCETFPDESTFRVLGTRLTIESKLKNILVLGTRRRKEALMYHVWLTRLVYYIESTLDWTYFMDFRRADQQLVHLRKEVAILRKAQQGKTG